MSVSVIIQGGPASFSALAAEALFGPKIELLCRDGFTTAMQAFHRTHGMHLLLPWWNRTIGPIDQVQTLIREAGLRHSDEMTQPVRHCLIGQTSGDLAGEVHSHPAALAQCHRFFRDNPTLHPRVGTDTADSLKRVRDGLARFAIASRQAAQRYGLPILAKDIQDRVDNATVFRLYRNR